MFEFLLKIFKSNLAQGRAITGVAGATKMARGVAAATLIDPVACAALKKRGNAFLAQGQLEGAANCYRQASEVNPQDVFAWSLVSGRKIFRQAASEDWRQPIEKVRNALLQRYPTAAMR